MPGNECGDGKRGRVETDDADDSNKIEGVTNGAARETTELGVEAGSAAPCIICVGDDPQHTQSACRGDAGLAHVECRAEAAVHRIANNSDSGW